MDGDSPLSITSNIVGLLTFVVAVIAGSYARVLTFQAKRRYRDEILKAILDTMGAFSETCTLAVGYDNLENEPYMPHNEVDKMLLHLYTNIFKLMVMFFDLGYKKSVSAARAVSKKSARWKSMASEIEAELSKVRQIYFLARLQDNILGRPRSSSSSSQNMRATPTTGGDEFRENDEAVAMPTNDIQNALVPDETNTNLHGLPRVPRLLVLSWRRVRRESFETPDLWQRRERLLKDIWDEFRGETPVGAHAELSYPIVLCIAVIQTITSVGREKLQRLSEKREQTPSTDDTEAQENKTATRRYLSRIANSFLEGLGGYGVSFSRTAFIQAGVALYSSLFSVGITWTFDTDLRRNFKITEKAYNELNAAISGTGEMSTGWVFDLKHMLEED